MPQPSMLYNSLASSIDQPRPPFAAGAATDADADADAGLSVDRRAGVSVFGFIWHPGFHVSVEPRVRIRVRVHPFRARIRVRVRLFPARALLFRDPRRPFAHPLERILELDVAGDRFDQRFVAFVLTADARGA